MSPAPFSRSADLKALREEGYFVHITAGFLVMREVPYLDAQRRLRTGTLLCPVELAGDVTCPPRQQGKHTAFFDGDLPHGVDGKPLPNLVIQSHPVTVAPGLTYRHYLSNKPECGFYNDYHHKLTTYANIISGPAAVVHRGISAMVYRSPEPDEDCIFNYIDTAAARAGIGALAARLASERVALIGLGGYRLLHPGPGRQDTRARDTCVRSRRLPDAQRLSCPRRPRPGGTQGSFEEG